LLLTEFLEEYGEDDPAHGMCVKVKAEGVTPVEEEKLTVWVTSQDGWKAKDEMTLKSVRLNVEMAEPGVADEHEVCCGAYLKLNDSDDNTNGVMDYRDEESPFTVTVHGIQPTAQGFARRAHILDGIGPSQSHQHTA
jgi:hypothetical protein